MNPHIVLVEDDEDLAKLTQNFLIRQGFEVSIVTDGLLAIEHILKVNPDVVLLDIMLPGCDGLEVCRKIRSRFFNPIIMLTARDDQIDQVLGLEIGADDYISKSVEPRLLAARIKAILRRDEVVKHGKKASVLDFGNLVFHSGAREVRVFNKPIDLTTPEYDLLWMLAKNAGFVLSREKIFESLRGIEYDGQNRLVDITISQIRAKLDHPKRIITVRNKGYLFSDQTDLDEHSKQ
ncbi:response regulator [Marinicellulosiphila megalodicopiae]|uniref:response regulator n=1 Tax=Marinicellulosiphila megalodicopiae TaxID=2724896 RepID=UPI003BAFC77D